MSSYIEAGLSTKTIPASVRASYVVPVQQQYLCCLHSGGVDVGARVAVTATNGEAYAPNFGSPAPGTYTVRFYSADGATLVSESGPVVVAASGPTTSDGILGPA